MPFVKALQNWDLKYASLEEPTTGKVFIAGQEMTHKNKRQLVRDNMSMVFQQFNLYPHMTVLKNLTLAPMKLHHKSKEEAEALAYHYLDVVGLRDKAFSSRIISFTTYHLKKRRLDCMHQSKRPCFVPI